MQSATTPLVLSLASGRTLHKVLFVIRHMAVWPLRVAAVTAALVLAAFFASYIRGCYTHLWVRYDGVSGSAVVSAEGQHGTVYYTYTVGGTTYAGHSQRDWQDARFGQVAVGGRPRVWYSAPHPWLSSLPKPSVGLDVGLLPLMLSFLLIAAMCGSYAFASRSKLIAFRSRHTGRAG